MFVHVFHLPTVQYVYLEREAKRAKELTSDNIRIFVPGCSPLAVAKGVPLASAAIVNNDKHSYLILALTSQHLSQFGK